ncbi:MAG: hypothetical protein CHACPFDD_03856 [Phycisphaerae bacterium]|nr:hypothetical protein [Phycisphaerae bacterium]
MPPTAISSPAEAFERFLHLKRVFLRTLVVSLVACAGIAVAALLLQTFGRTTFRILGTLASLAIHSGVAIACADCIERRRWPVLSGVGLLLFATNFALHAAMTWWPGLSMEWTARAWGCTSALMAGYILAIPCADLIERRINRVLGSIGLAACAIAFGGLQRLIWVDSPPEVEVTKAIAVGCIAAFTLAHTCLLVRVPGGTTLAQVARLAVIAAWLTGGWGSVVLTLELDPEPHFRILGALGVLDACATLALVLMAKIRKTQRVEALVSTERQIQIVCPRCTAAQTVNAGASKCGACGLKFRIEIDEPRCAHCDYLLWQLSDRRCPECGHAF